MSDRVPRFASNTYLELHSGSCARCKNCGEVVDLLPRPMSINAFIAYMNGMAALHSECPPTSNADPEAGAEGSSPNRQSRPVPATSAGG